MKKNGQNGNEVQNRVQTVLQDLIEIGPFNESKKSALRKQIKKIKSQNSDILIVIEQVIGKDYVEFIKKNQYERREFIEEIFIIDQLLERFYINSTDIEFAQFYNKELTLRLDILLNEVDENFEENFKIKEKVNLIFGKIEQKKDEYFMSGNKEIDRRESVFSVDEYLRNQVELLQGEVKKLKKQNDDLNDMERFSKYENQIKKLTNENDEFFRENQKTIETCKRYQIQVEELTKLLQNSGTGDRLSQLIQEVKENQRLQGDEIDSLEKQIETLKETNKNYEREKLVLLEKNEETEKKNQQLQNEIHQLKLDVIKSNKNLQATNYDMKTNVDQYEFRVNEKEIQIKILLEQLQNLKDQQRKDQIMEQSQFEMTLKDHELKLREKLEKDNDQKESIRRQEIFIHQEENQKLKQELEFERRNRGKVQVLEKQVKQLMNEIQELIKDKEESNQQLEYLLRQRQLDQQSKEQYQVLKERIKQAEEDVIRLGEMTQEKQKEIDELQIEKIQLELKIREQSQVKRDYELIQSDYREMISENEILKIEIKEYNHIINSQREKIQMIGKTLSKIENMNEEKIDRQSFKSVSVNRQDYLQELQRRQEIMKKIDQSIHELNTKSIQKENAPKKSLANTTKTLFQKI